MSDDSLLDEIAEAEQANQHARPCQVCAHLEVMSDERHDAISRALAGTIGEAKLAEILTRNGFTTGRRAIRRHRQEGHTP